jgi:hypothetical protein
MYRKFNAKLTKLMIKHRIFKGGLFSERPVSKSERKTCYCQNGIHAVPLATVLSQTLLLCAQFLGLWLFPFTWYTETNAEVRFSSFGSFEL